jgi:hypothetical protein
MSRSGAAVTLLLFLLCLAAIPAAQAQEGQCPVGIAHCIPPPYSVPAAPVWATLNGIAGDNYPGGNETFTVFFVNSDSPPLGKVTLLSETLTSPFGNATVGGLPVELASGESLSSNITVQIPRDFAGNNFTANIVIHINVANATVASAPGVLTGSAQVFMLGYPLGGVPRTSSATSTQHTTTQSGTVSTSLFYAGVGIPSLVVIVLFAILVRDRGRQPLA